MLIVDDKWMKAVNNISKSVNMIGKRKTSKKGVMLASFLGLGMSAAAYRLGKNQNRNKSDKLQSLMDNFQKSKNISLPNAAIAEFAKELSPKVNHTSSPIKQDKNENFSESIQTEEPIKNDLDELVK